MICNRHSWTYSVLLPTMQGPLVLLLASSYHVGETAIGETSYFRLRLSGNIKTDPPEAQPPSK